MLILDNSITGMTGHQQNPSTGLTLQGREAPVLDLEALCRAVGVRRVRVVDPHHMDELEAALKEELAAPEPSVIIVRRPCVLLKYVPKKKALTINTQACKNCGACLRIGCPAISKTAQGMKIDQSLCVGCGLCVSMCKFGAIEGAEE